MNFLTRKRLLVDLHASTVAQAKAALQQSGLEVLVLMRRGEEGITRTAGLSNPSVLLRGRGANAAYMPSFVHFLYVRRRDYKRAQEILHEAGLL